MPGGNMHGSHSRRILRPGGISAKERTHMRAVHKHTYTQTQALFSGVLMFNSVNFHVQT